VLFVDDERDMVSSLSRYFRLHGFTTAGAFNVAEAVSVLEGAASKREPFDCVCTDLRMPDGDGLSVLRAVRKLMPGTPVIVLTAFGSVATSVEAMRLGALTMLEKPFPVAQLEREVRAAMSDAHEVQGAVSAAGSAGLIGNSVAIRTLFDTLVRVAPSNSSVLLQGESGTGKELVAQAIHRFSRRAMGPLVAVNCAAIPEPLLESELFGHVKGAFTGAVALRTGRFKAAHLGTIFLDEIGELPLTLQGKLLRVLQERTIEPIGSSRPEPVDFRVVAASNRNLEEMVAKGTFRSDLFYRLNVVPLVLPALRDRPGDVPVLVKHFLVRANEGRSKKLSFAPETLAAMDRYAWPGNVRELENLVERLTVMRPEGEIVLSDLPPNVANAPPRPGPASSPAGAFAPAGSPASAPSPASASAGAAAGTGSSSSAGPEGAQGSGAAAGLGSSAGAGSAGDSGVAQPGAPYSLPPGGVDLYAVLAELEDRLIREALERSGGNKNQAAKILGLNRTTLVEKLKKKNKSPPGAGGSGQPG
jgi:DNA-binding NtrC family response regulator